MLNGLGDGGQGDVFEARLQLLVLEAHLTDKKTKEKKIRKSGEGEEEGEDQDDEEVEETVVRKLGESG